MTRKQLSHAFYFWYNAAQVAREKSRNVAREYRRWDIVAERAAALAAIYDQALEAWDRA